MKLKSNAFSISFFLRTKIPFVFCLKNCNKFLKMLSIIQIRLKQSSKSINVNQNQSKTNQKPIKIT